RREGARPKAGPGRSDGSFGKGKKKSWCLGIRIREVPRGSIAPRFADNPRMRLVRKARARPSLRDDDLGARAPSHGCNEPRRRAGRRVTFANTPPKPEERVRNL